MKKDLKWLVIIIYHKQKHNPYCCKKMFFRFSFYSENIVLNEQFKSQEMVKIEISRSKSPVVPGKQLIPFQSD